MPIGVDATPIRDLVPTVRTDELLLPEVDALTMIAFGLASGIHRSFPEPLNDGVPAADSSIL